VSYLYQFRSASENSLIDQLLDIIYLYLHDYVEAKDFSGDSQNIFPSFHIIYSCDRADQSRSDHFSVTEISHFRPDFHSFNDSIPIDQKL
jgi:hypothetical protein